MRPRQRQKSGQNDLFKARLDQIVDINRPLMKLARAIDWDFLEKSFGAVYSDGPGQPPLPTRLMAGLAILKHTDDLSDDFMVEPDDTAPKEDAAPGQDSTHGDHAM